VPDVEAPEIEIDEDAPKFRRRLALVVVLITLFGAVLAYLHEQNSNLEDNAARDAQIEAIRGFGQQVDASTEFQLDYRLFVEQQLLQRRQQVAQSRARTTGSDLTEVYSADAARLGELSTAVADGAAVQSDADVAAKDAELQVAPDKAVLTQHVFADKSNDYGNKADSYVAVLTVLAVGLFLIGLSLTVTGRGRYLLAVPGVAIALVCVVWATLITFGSVTSVSPRAIDLTAEGQRKQLTSDVPGAIADYKAAIDESPSFGPPFARLADAEFQNGSVQAGSNAFQSIADPEATKRAIIAGEKAIALGENNPSFLSSIGFFHFTLREYDRAEELSKLALEGNDQIAPLIFNLGVTQAAKNQKSAARATYQRGIDVLEKEQDLFLRHEIISAGLTDLEIADTTATDAKDLIQELKGELAGVVFDDDADGSDATAEDIEIRNDRFRLLADYTTTNLADDEQLTNIWYYRQLDKDGNSTDGPFTQAFLLDSTSVVTDGQVSTSPAENGDCLPGGDYRVEVYAGNKLIGSNNDDPLHLPDSPLGSLLVEGGDDLGVVMCRPDTWEATSSTEDGSLSFSNPDDATQSMFAFTFPLGDSTLGTTQLQDAAIAGVVATDQVSGQTPPEDGNEFLGRTVDGREIELATRTVEGQRPDGRTERITVSVDAEGVVRLAVLTAGNPDDLETIRSELINSIRFLDLPAPAP
jgi:tetratricopeptide (TPR) repeat protein